MFSFWSNDEGENSDPSNDSDNEKDKNTKPERFLYVGNDKRGESPNPLTGNDVFQNNRNANVLNERKKRMDDMLNNVWSVRKDVRVNNSTVKATDIGTKSFYSRHGGVSGVGAHTDPLNERNPSTGGVPSKSWSVPRTGYSYSDNAQINQYDILEDNTATDVIPRTVPSNHTDDVLRQNIVNSLKQSLKHGSNLTSREPSARTRRAQKFNNAYLRSTGMGKFTPGLKKPSGQHNDKDNSWKR